MQLQTKAGAVSDSVIVFNAGINGNNTADLLARLDKDVLRRSPQLVVLLIGTNDMLNGRNMLSLHDYEKNYQQLLTGLKEKCRVIMMTIPPVNSAYLVVRKPEMKWKGNGPQCRVDSANTIIHMLAAKNNCTLVDLHNILMGCGGSHTGREALFQNEANSGTADGVHPTAQGYQVIASAVYQAIRLTEPDAKSIVCFGDSITFGYQVEGDGTTQGESYPAVLNTMINQ